MRDSVVSLRSQRLARADCGESGWRKVSRGWKSSSQPCTGRQAVHHLSMAWVGDSRGSAAWDPCNGGLTGQLHRHHPPPSADERTGEGASPVLCIPENERNAIA